MAELNFRALVETMPDVLAVVDRDLRYVYVNDAIERAVGISASSLIGKQNDDVMKPADAALWRAAASHVLASGEARTIECVLDTPRGPRVFAAVLTRLPDDQVCVVSRDVTDVRSADRARRLQQLTAALSRALDRDEVIRTVVTAGGSALGAAAGFGWMLRDDGETFDLAFADHDGRSNRIDQFRTFAMKDALPVCDVIRNQQPMMFETLEALASSYPLAGQRGNSPYNAWMVMPFIVGGRAIGAASFSFEHARTFDVEDRELLTAMIGQAELALERSHLIEAERRARADAERARLRERQLHVLAAKLSSALTQEQIGSIVSAEATAMLGAFAGTAWLRVGDHLRIIGASGPVRPDIVQRYARVPLETRLPSADAVRQERLVWCASEAELMATYPHQADVWRPYGLQTWGAIPFTFEGRTSGALAMAYTQPRELAAEERDFVHAVAQLAAQALERCRLSRAQQTSDDQLRLALTGARAATWSLDIKTMQSRRDPSYCALVGVAAAEVSANFMSIHPDDQPIAKAAFERTIREGVPYEPEVRVRRDDGSYMWIRAHARVSYDDQGAPHMLAGVIVDIDDAKQASLREQTLQRLATSFASELDEDRLIQLIVDELGKLVDAELATFTFAGGGSATTRGDRSLIGRAGSVITMPVSVRSGEVLGTLLLARSERGSFTSEHTRMATAVASQAAVALENARLYKTVLAQKQQLEIAVDQARLADRRKDEFLAMLSHELRNPLAPIATALELMEMKEGGDIRKERAVIRRQVDHLSRLIDDLLDVSRITRGKIQLSRQVVELSAVLAKAIEMASPLLERRMQRLSVDVPRTGLLVDADPTRLAQVFQNLVTNAAKYSDHRSLIEVRARAEQARVVVEIRDEGIGIAPALLPHLFDLFVQGERALDRSDGGLGIGLTIAKSLCLLHGGTIEARSEGPGKGSTFVVTLSRVAALAPSPRTGKQTERMPALATGTRVLVVDDNIDAANMLRDFLEALGHEPAIAHDGPAALELASSFKPDIAVLDIGLPVMNGYEVARQLRQTLGPEKLRLIAVTGYGQDTDRARALEVGFDHHLIKPIELDALLSLLGKA